MKIKPGVSVIICCYNSATRIAETLRHLAQQINTATIPYEIILVNNNSSDHTAEIATIEWEKYNQPEVFKIVNQPIGGLTAARQMGIEATQYSYLLFCDDDNWLCNTYLSTVYKVMESNPDIGVLGGQAIAKPEPPVPPWFVDRAAQYTVGPQDGFVKKYWVYGAGSVYRKEALEKLRQKGWKQITTDRIGDKLMYGGDNELCYMISLTGYKIVYDEQLLFYHFIPNTRLNNRYLVVNHFASAYCLYLLYPYEYLLYCRAKGKSVNSGFNLYIVKRILMAFFLNARVIVYPGRFSFYKRRLSLLSILATFSAISNTKRIIRQFQHVSTIYNKIHS